MGKEKNYHLNHNCVAKGKCTSMKTRLADDASRDNSRVKIISLCSNRSSYFSIFNQ